MKVGTDNFSRYYGKNVLIENGVQRQETYDYPDIVSIEGESYIVPVKYANRMDLIAYEKYKNPLLWWVIALASAIKDPLTVPAGTVLLVPTEREMLRIRGVI